MKRSKFFLMTAALIAALFVFGGCGGGSSRDNADRGEVLDVEFGDEWEATFPDPAAAAVPESIRKLIGAALNVALAIVFGNNVPENIGSAATDTLLHIADAAISSDKWYVPIPYDIKYTTVNESGTLVSADMRLIVPCDFKASKRPELPMLSIQHPTQIERKYSPSKILVVADPQLTVAYGTLLAMLGYIVVIPDLLGLGDNTDPHPYCVESVANAIEDGIKAADAFLNHEKQNSWFISKWNKKPIYLTGYSEGGHASVVAAKKLQASNFPVARVAPIGGAYSLSVSMRKVMLKEDPGFLSPYFLPVTLVAYEEAYSKKYPELSFKSTVREDRQNLRKLLFEGKTTAKDISAMMKTVPDYKGPISITTPEFQKLLKDDNSSVVKALAENNAFTGWSPKGDMEIKLFHIEDDDLLPVENVYEAIKGFNNNPKVTSGVFSYKGLDVDPSLHVSRHVVSALGGYLLSFRWIDQHAYPNRNTTKPLNFNWLVYSE